MDEQKRLQFRLVFIATVVICITVIIATWSESGPIAMTFTGALSSVLFLLLLKWEDIFVRKYRHGKSLTREYRKDKERIYGQKQRDEEDKLERILAYTRSTFIRLEFDEDDVLTICRQVAHFVRYGTADEAELRIIPKKYDVTQASLKNFAWNIGFQYGISRMATATFVISVFEEWFYNTEKQSVYRTLKTTSGIHAIRASTEII